MRQLIFVTHAQVSIDPAVPVTDWPLSPAGRARHAAHAARLGGIGCVVSSSERKARDAAAIYADALGLSATEDPGLGENDRSATGYLPPPEFEATADAFFANPTHSIRGWERAVDAQARVLAALQRVCTAAPDGDILVAAHGAVGALLRAHVLGAPIDRSHDQPPTGGGNVLRLALPRWTWLSGWITVDEDGS